MRKDTSAQVKKRTIARNYPAREDPEMIATQKPASEDLRQQWTQHCEEQAREAVWELHTTTYKIRETYLENQATLFRRKIDTGVISRAGISHEERYYIDTGASMHMLSKSDFTPERARHNSEIERNFDYFGERVNYHDRRSCCPRQRL